MKAKRIVALLLALIMILGMTACGGEEAADPAAIVAKVGDVEFTQKQWDDYSELVFYGTYGMEISDLESQEGYEEFMSYLEKSMLTSMVSAEVLKQEYAAQGVDALGSAYEEDLELFLSTVKAQIPDFIEKHGLSDEMLTMYFESQQYLVYAMNECAVPDSEADVYYEENKELFITVEDVVRASHILVEEEELAKDIIAQYEAGADFAELAFEYGTDGTQSTGGDLGPFVYGDMVEDFSKAAFALEAGEHSKEPVKSDFGYHVILVTERVNAGEAQPLEWVRANILTDLDSMAYYEMMDGLMEIHPVEYFVEGMDEVL